MIILEWAPRDNQPQKVVFDPQPDQDCTWLRCEYEHRNGAWRLCGCEPLESLSVEHQSTDPATDRSSQGGEHNE
ncbi:hypothetical protein [Natronosalvus caseinilyticus]|uniref:hypothetical protein n=1 Tax=Natronosalvus caseinilyticus TaxID=2953747 RepID=UPI0028A760AD|nr:hypothetical protein [Natronosalvus caseinilyticus]